MITCQYCQREITQGNHDHLWRHVLNDGTFTIQCPDVGTIAQPAGTIAQPTGGELRYCYLHDEDEHANLTAQTSNKGKKTEK